MSYSTGMNKDNTMVTECRERILRIIMSKPAMGMRAIYDGTAVSIAAYLLWKISLFSNPMQMRFEDLNKASIDGEIIELAKRNGIDAVWNELVNLCMPISEDVLKAAVINNNEPDYSKSGDSKTPYSIISLAGRILNLRESDVFADLCCGTGSVSFALATGNTVKKAVGYDIFPEAITLARMFNEVADSNIQFENEDVFRLVLNEQNRPYFDKIFANYPFGVRIKDVLSGMVYTEILEKRIPSVSKATSSDWLYNTAMVDMLAENGKAIGIMTNGSTWNMIDTPIRKYFVENGLIECVIALPARLFGSFGISTSLIVLSHGNKGVRLIDASEQYVAGRRVNELSEQNIEYIIGAMTEDNENSIFVSVDELRSNDYVLNTNRYRRATDEIKDGVKFESVIKRITRGAPLNAKELDSLSSPVPTNMQYLMLANIQDGMIDKDLPYLTTIEKKNEKYCLSNRCLILSKNGYPYKIAVAEVGENQKIMANGNLYIIEIDEGKADPYYLAAFFASEQGIASLRSITVGATIPNIGVEQLKSLIIPVPALDKQKEVAETYQAIKDEIALLQLKIEKAKNRLNHIMEGGTD